MIERHLDYATYSAIISEHSLIENGLQSVPPPRFYKRGYEDGWGRRYFFGNPNSKKALIVISGTAFVSMRDDGNDDKSILAKAIESGATFSRLDLAITDYIEDDFITVGDVQSWYEKQKITSVLTTYGAKMISGYQWDFVLKPETFYVGSLEKRGEKGIFRAYDKSLDLGIGNEIITRIELEERGEKSHNTAKRIADTGDISGNFRARFNVDDVQFERLMDAPAVEIQRGLGLRKKEEDEKMDGRWEWLMKQVAPSLKEAREYDMKHENKDSRFYWFLREAGITHDEIKSMLVNMKTMWDNTDSDADKPRVSGKFKEKGVGSDG